MGSCDVEPKREFIKVGEHILAIEKVDNCDNEECGIYISELSEKDITAFEEDRVEDGGLDKSKLKTLGMWGYPALDFTPKDFLEYYLDTCESVLEEYLSAKDTKKALKELRGELLD